MENLRIVVAGQSGAGKTRWARRVVTAWPGRIVVLTDDARDYADLPLTWVRVEGRHVGWRLPWLRRGRWLVEVTAVSRQELLRLSESIATALWQGDPGLILVDEAHQFMPRHPQLAAWQRHATGGRHRGLSYVWICQSLVDMDLAALRMATHLVAFRVIEQWESDRLQRLSGGWLTPAALRALPTGVGILVDLRRGRWGWVISDLSGPLSLPGRSAGPAGPSPW